MSAYIEPREALRSLDGYHSPQLNVSVRLNTNESPYAPPEDFVEAWLAAVRGAALHRYPDRAAKALRGALGEHLNQPPERLFCANGSNEVLQTILLTYGGPSRRCLIFEPTYALHAHVSRITGTEIIARGRLDDFTVDPHDAIKTVVEQRPAVTFLCSPNNPTGTLEARETVEAILDAVARVGGLLVVDEAYGEFASYNAAAFVSDETPLVIVRTASKVWSLAAIRLGYAIGPTWLIDNLYKVVLPYHLSTPTQLAGVAALQFGDQMDDRVRRLEAERDRMSAVMRMIGALTVFPSQANFILFRVAGDAHALWTRMVERGVLVRDFSSWPGVEQCLRVTVGTPEENDAFLGALHEAVREDM